MQYLSSIPHVWREVLVAAGGGILLIVLAIWVRYGRRNVVIKESDTTRILAYQLARIADTLERLERLVPARETQTQPPADTEAPQRSTWLSMFGR